MTNKTTSMILILMLTGIALGAALGFYFPSVMLSISVIGRLFVSALQLLVMPLIVASIIVAIASFGDIRKLGRSLVTALAYFVGTSTIAVCIGLVLVTLIHPGWGVSAGGTALPDEVAKIKSTGIIDILPSFIPTSLPQAVLEGQYLGMIVFSLFFGSVLATLGRRGRIVVDFFKGIYEVILRLVYLVLYAAPIGLFAIVGSIVAKNSGSLGELSGSLFYYSLTLGAGLLIHAVIALPLVLKFIGQRSPLQYFGNMAPALSTALGTASSAVALPVTYANVVEKNKVDSRAGSLVLPLGMAMNLNGTAMFVTIAALFIAQIYGISLSAMQIITMAAVSILVSLGASSIPHAGIFLLVFVLRAGGFPEEAYAGIGLIIVVDWLFERFRAAVNVWGDSVGAAVVSRTFEPEEDRKRRPARLRSQEAAPRERVTRVPASAHRSDAGQVRAAQRRRDEQKPPAARRQRDTTRRSAAIKRGPNERRGESERHRRDKAGWQRPAHKPEPEQVTPPVSADSTYQPAETPSPNGSPPSVSSESTTPNSAESASRPNVPRAVSEQETAPAEMTEAPPPEYGRLKSRRGRVVKDKQAPSSPDEPATLNGQEEYPLENISFGRKKKKRQR